MNKKLVFETLGELKATYPIGSVFSKKVEHYTESHTFYNDRDYRVFLKNSDKVEIIDTNTCICYKTKITLRIVEGYIYNGEYWCPAYNTWDGWVEYDESDKRDEETWDFI